MTAPYSSSRFAYEGTETTETSIVRSGGSVDPAGQAQSRKVVTTANCQWLRPFRCAPWAIWNETVGADVIVTIYGVTDGGLPNNDQAFIDVEYLSDASSTLGSIATTSKANVLATGVAVASDSSTWSTPAPPSFTPASLTGLIGWWDAKVTASLTLTGSNIDAVADQSGAGNNLTWTGAKPTYSATGFNSQPAIMLGGQASGQALANTAFPLGTGTALTFWWVGSMTSALTGTGNAGIVSYVGAGQANDWGNSASFTTYRSGASNTQMYFARSGSSSTLFTHTADANHRYIVTISASGVPTIYVDGVPTTGATLAANWASPGYLRIGRTAAGDTWAGPVGEIGIATGYTDATTAAQLDAYLNTKWGLGAVASTWTPFKLTGVLGSATVSTPTAFDPATASNIALSNSNRTATASGGAMGVRSTEYRTTGKYYFEVTLTSVHGNGDLVGVVLSTATYSDTYSGVNCVAVNKVAGNIYINNAINGSIGALVIGDIISVAVDLTAHKAWIRKNGGAWNNGDPATGTGLTMASGAFAPFVVFGGTGSTVGDNMTANFGQLAFAYAVPTGFTGGWTAVNSTPQPGRPGLIHVRPKIGKASATVYLDPKIELTPASAAPSATHKSSRYAYEGTETTETSIVRTGGTAHSRKIVTTANSQWLRPYRAEPYAVWNDTVGADVTVTVYGLFEGSSLPLDDEAFMDVEYLNTTYGTIVSTTKANVLATGVSVASDSSVWATPGASYATWDAATVTAVTLSGGDLVATNTGTTSTNQGAHVASAFEKNSGKYYFEIEWTTLSGGSTGNTGVGVGTAASTYTNMGNGGTTGVMNYRLQSIYSNGSMLQTIQTGWIAGQKCGVAVDLDNRKIWFRNATTGGNWNYVSGTSNPATNVGGFTIPAGMMVPFVTFGGTGGLANHVFTANFGASAFAGSVPSGFTSGWPGAAATFTPFKLVATLNAPQPGQPGLINVRVKAAKPSATYYIDPTPVLSSPSTPAWLPAGDVVYLDFVSGYYYAGGEVQSRAVLAPGGSVDAGGLYGHNLDPSNCELQGDALAALTNDAGITIIFEYYLPQTHDASGMNVNIHTSSSNQFNGANDDSGFEFYDATGPDTGTIGVDQVGISRVAMSFNATNYYGSFNGGAASTYTMGSPPAFSISAGITNCTLFTFNSSGTLVDGPRIRSLRIRAYTAPAGLPALSALS